jgi:Arc/MetJ-type ribon-helix-helix transcriptional regulator
MNEHARTTITLSLAPEDIERLDLAVREGGYASREELVMDALRNWAELDAGLSIDDEDLAHHYREGLASGEPAAVDIRDLVARMKAARDGKA